MRVLFVMAYPGYLRYFDSTLRLLSERGHQVDVFFDSLDKQSEGLEGLDGSDQRITVGGRVPKPMSIWRRLKRDLRWTTDFIRYLDERYADAHYLRGRVAERLPESMQWLDKAGPLHPRVAARLPSLIQLTEEAIPLEPEFEQFLSGVDPDLLVVTPLITLGSNQNDLVKTGRALGIPTAAPVASWDHLTTKGMLRAFPDLVLVWNEHQRTEAETLHGYPADRVTVTGSPPFDRWFGREPGTPREEFCRRVGLADQAPFVLFTGSTASISSPIAEVAFVERWIAALRASDDPAVRDLGVLVRPHPYNISAWQHADLSRFGNVSIWPRAGANPAASEDQGDYFDSLFHSAAVVGINTSAMIEAAIVGRPVLTIRAPEFVDTQSGTLHFQYLLPENGGFLRVAGDLDEHVDQLAGALGDPEGTRNQIESFVESFIRPQGLDRAATPVLVDALEQLVQRGPAPARPRFLRLPLRAGLWFVAVALTAREPGRVSGILRQKSKRVPSTLTRAGDAVERRSSRSAARLGNPVGRWLAALGTTCAGWLRAGRTTRLFRLPLDLIAGCVDAILARRVAVRAKASASESMRDVEDLGPSANGTAETKVGDHAAGD